MADYEGPGWNYGSYEAKIKHPGKGYWSAFWLFNKDEIDIYERFIDTDEFKYSAITQECGPQSKWFTMPAGAKDNFNTYRLDWTPFKLSFFFNGQKMPGELFRFYDLNGQGMDLECGDVLPAGMYTINPYFPEIRDRFFRPIIGCTVLPSYGLKCCGNNEFCSQGNCNLQPCSDWGNPLDRNGVWKQDGYLLATTVEIDYVKVTQTPYTACGGIVVRSPQYTCVGDTADIILEDIGGLGYHTVDIISFVNSSNISVAKIEKWSSGEDGLRVIGLQTGNASINLAYKDACGNIKNKVLEIEVLGGDFNPEVAIDMGDCGDNIILNLDEFSACLINGDYGELLSANFTLYDKDDLSNSELLEYTVDGFNVVIQLPTDFYKRNIEDEDFRLDISISYVGLCGDTITFDTLLELENCNTCCPRNSWYDSENCAFDLTFPDGFNGWAFGNSFYVTPNPGHPQADADGCPPGYTFDGSNCYSGVHFDASRYNGWAWNNRFYVTPNCNLCCPEDSEYDSENCAYELYLPAGYQEVFKVDPVTKTGTMGVIPDPLQPNSDANGCPPGYIFDGQYCLSSVTYDSRYFDPFVWEGRFYVQANCDAICCPDGYTDDGNACRYLLDNIASDSARYIDDEGQYVINCQQQTPNDDCCPDGTTHLGNGKCLILDVSEYKSFVYNNTLHVSYVPCVKGIGDTLMNEPELLIDPSTHEAFVNERSVVQDIRVFPNPTGDGQFTIHVNQAAKIDRIDVYSTVGRPLRSINDVDARSMKLDLFDYPDGLYYVRVKVGDNYFISRIITR